jgi:hypothetical protein
VGIPQRGINGQSFNWFPALCLGFLVHGDGVHGKAFQNVQRMNAKAMKAKAEPMMTILSDWCMMYAY